jgi:hypothetical protein
MDDRPSQHELLVLPLFDDGRLINILLFAFWFRDTRAPTASAASAAPSSAVS